MTKVAFYFCREAVVQITQLNIYPVKSLKGISVTQSELQEHGLAWDRRWMLVDAQQRFVLVPRGLDAGFRELTLALEGNTLQGMEVQDNLNQRVVITFTALDTQLSLIHI